MYDLNGLPTKENILSKIAQEDIFAKYLGFEPDLDRGFVNPWRNDIKPDCRFYWDNRNPPMLKFNDFAGGHNWDCFNVVQIVYNCNFQEALEIIANDFKLSNRKVNKELLSKRDINKQLALFEKQNTQIQVRIRDWWKVDIQYWEKYYIDLETLTYYNVYAIDYAWLNGRICYEQRSNDIGYAYYLGNDDWKLYFPNRKNNRFIHNNAARVQGYRQLEAVGDILIDTKSLKDVMALRRFGYNAVAPMTETIPLSEKAYKHLKTRFTHILGLKDRDRTGDKMSILMRNTYPDYINLRFKKEDEKDFSDNLHIYGVNYMLDYIEETRETLGI